MMSKIYIIIPSHCVLLCVFYNIHFSAPIKPLRARMFNIFFPLSFYWILCVRDETQLTHLTSRERKKDNNIAKWSGGYKSVVIVSLLFFTNLRILVVSSSWRRVDAVDVERQARAFRKCIKILIVLKLLSHFMAKSGGRRRLNFTQLLPVVNGDEFK